MSVESSISVPDVLQTPRLRHIRLPAETWDDLVKTAASRQPDVQVGELAAGVHRVAEERHLLFPRDEWVKAAFVKLASLGALVMLPTANGKYLLQRNGPEDFNPGKLRPPGGHHEKEDETLLATILREVQEEFDLSKKEVEASITFIGRDARRGFSGNAIFELKDHNLRPGFYQASNSPDEKIELVEASIDHPDYVGPLPWKLISEAAYLKGIDLGKFSKINKS